VTRLTQASITRLRQVADVPDLTHTRYEIVELLGHGGMGAVYLAQDRELDRLVALKVVGTAVTSPALVARLIREARILARLEHPSIVPVHDVGLLPDGRPFYTMKRVRGRRLDQHITSSTPLAERLQTFERICDAVAFAHAHGVIHRDLKPANVMVGAFGEVLVMDWGVARMTGQEEIDDGTIVGTPGYMSPEQSRGETSAIDERTDVHALGALLRFLLPSDAPRPLQSVVLKAVDPDPARRYRGVTELAADIARFRDALPVEAYRESLLDRALRIVTKYRVPLALIAAYVLMRLVLLVAFRS
jgi:serine/threonine protein kinase